MNDTDSGKYRLFGIFGFFLRFSVFFGFLNTDFGFGFFKYRGFGFEPTSSGNCYSHC
jgi:hypothetical protein